MRISNILSAYSRPLSSKNSAPKNTLSKNITFGKIDPENREKILANLPELTKDPDLIEWRRNLNIELMDKLVGATVKWGGEGNPKGLIYAELDQEHVEKSCLKWAYEEIETEHLEEEENLRAFVMEANEINKRENPDGTRKAQEPLKPAEPEPEPYDAMKELFEASLGW